MRIEWNWIYPCSPCGWRHSPYRRTDSIAALSNRPRQHNTVPYAIRCVIEAAHRVNVWFWNGHSGATDPMPCWQFVRRGRVFEQANRSPPCTHRRLFPPASYAISVSMTKLGKQYETHTQTKGPGIYLVYVVSIDGGIEARVQIVKQVDHLRCGTMSRYRCEPCKNKGITISMILCDQHSFYRRWF